ncbi:MAG: 2Fe-2S iron-sulfur cluster-binding protein [bacterium]
MNYNDRKLYRNSPVTINSYLKQKVEKLPSSSKEGKGNAVYFNIDGQNVEGNSGETILDIANRYKIKIPTLCHHPSVKSFGACRLCLVEVTQGKITKLQPSCMFSIAEGLVVKTSTERVINARKIILELLLARCPEADLIKEMAFEMGIKETRFKKREEPDKCTLCGLCVRTCEENVGAFAISFAKRGPERLIATPFKELSDTCLGCAECAKVCPTGELTIERIDKDFRKNKATVAIKCDTCAGYSNRACVINCPTGALKLSTIKDYLSKHKKLFIDVELKEHLRYSLEEGEKDRRGKDRS